MGWPRSLSRASSPSTVPFVCHSVITPAAPAPTSTCPLWLNRAHCAAPPVPPRSCDRGASTDTAGVADEPKEEEPGEEEEEEPEEEEEGGGGGAPYVHVLSPSSEEDASVYATILFSKKIKKLKYYCTRYCTVL